MKRLLLVAVFALSSILSIKVWAQWKTEFVDTTGKVGNGCAIAVGGNRYPHISYKDVTVEWQLKYAHWNGSLWQIAFVKTTDVYGVVTSIALDGAGNPHIAFDKGDQLWHAWWDGASWQREGVDSLPGGTIAEWNSIAIDTDSYPHIAYTYYTGAGNCYLRYAYKDASGWHIQVADSLIGNEFKYGCSIALDDSNHPYISYYDYNAYDLKYAYRDGSAWHIKKVDSVGNVGKYSSIALDSLDYPRIAYMDYTNYGVKYARWDGSAWHIETVESGVGYGFYTSLALDANDRPHISSAEYMDDLRFAWWDGSDWQIEVVDNTVGCGWTSLAIDDSGYCHIAYYNDVLDEYALKYAKRIPTTGVEETHPIPEVLRLAQNQPNPVISGTYIEYGIPQKTSVALKIYDLAGRNIWQWSISAQKCGRYRVYWNGQDNNGQKVANGIYFYTLEAYQTNGGQAGEFKAAKKLTVLR